MSVKRPWFLRRGPKSLGQSLVEFTVLLPVLLIMISGLIEFGIMLNYYLDVIDAAREAARYASDVDLIHDPNDPDVPLELSTNPAYKDIQDLAMQSLAAASDGRVDWPKMRTMYGALFCNYVRGDIVIYAFGVRNNLGLPVVDKRFPTDSGENGHTLCNHYFSKFTSAEIAARLDAAAPTTGLVLVEIFFDYDQVLALPWITVFVPDPIRLHAFTIMPNSAVEPTPTPPP
jgi:hypothetical protein